MKTAIRVIGYIFLLLSLATCDLCLYKEAFLYAGIMLLCAVVFFIIICCVRRRTLAVNANGVIEDAGSEHTAQYTATYDPVNAEEPSVGRKNKKRDREENTEIDGGANPRKNKATKAKAAYTQPWRYAEDDMPEAASPYSAQQTAAYGVAYGGSSMPAGGQTNSYAGGNYGAASYQSNMYGAEAGNSVRNAYNPSAGTYAANGYAAGANNSGSYAAGGNAAGAYAAGANNSGAYAQGNSTADSGNYNTGAYRTASYNYGVQPGMANPPYGGDAAGQAYSSYGNGAAGQGQNYSSYGNNAAGQTYSAYGNAATGREGPQYAAGATNQKFYGDVNTPVTTGNGRNYQQAAPARSATQGAYAAAQGAYPAQAGVKYMRYCKSCGFLGSQLAEEAVPPCPTCGAQLFASDVPLSEFTMLDQRKRSAMMRKWAKNV